MKVLLDEVLMEPCTGCAGRGYWERKADGPRAVTYMVPCKHCHGMGLIRV